MKDFCPSLQNESNRRKKYTHYCTIRGGWNPSNIINQLLFEQWSFKKNWFWDFLIFNILKVQKLSIVKLLNYLKIVMLLNDVFCPIVGNRCAKDHLFFLSFLLWMIIWFLWFQEGVLAWLWQPIKIKYYSHEIFDVAKWGIHDFYDNIMIDFAITMKPSVSRVIDCDYYVQGVSRLETQYLTRL